MARLLLTHGADASARDKDGVTSLHAATCGAHVGVARLLIDSKADLNARDNAGSSALWTAAYKGGWSLDCYGLMFFSSLSRKVIRRLS